jgi:hypothetical protein
LAQWGGGCVRVDGSSGYVREEGMKDHVVFAIEEKNGGESSTDNDYSNWVHLLAPIALPDTTEKCGVLMAPLFTGMPKTDIWTF